jgi:hypothetical protein
MKITMIAVSTAALVALALAGCGTASRPVATPTVTHTITKRPPAAAAPAPTVTHTVTIRPPPATATPAPTVTITNTVSGPPSGQQSSSAGSSGGGQVIVRFSGSGTLNTAPFTTPSSWALSWAYWGCPNGKSNFAVTEYNADGSIDLNGVSVNELGTGRGPVATHAYGDAGKHYLKHR